MSINHFFLLLVASFSLVASETIEIDFEERPPYVVKDEKSLKGILGSVVVEAFDKADIEYILMEKPSKRHLHEIKANREKLCAIGWFKNSEREEYGKYSDYLYQDKPMGVITRRDDTRFEKLSGIDGLLEDKNLKLLVKASYSYGAFIDEKIQKYNTPKQEVYSDNIKMLTLISKKRADYLFISYEEAEDILEESKLKDRLKFVEIDGMPEGNKRYLICSKKVSDEEIAKINSYIKR